MDGTAIGREQDLSGKIDVDMLVQDLGLMSTVSHLFHPRTPEKVTDHTRAHLWHPTKIRYLTYDKFWTYTTFVVLDFRKQKILKD